MYSCAVHAVVKGYEATYPEVQCRAKFNEVPCSTVQFRSMQCSAVQVNAVQWSAVQCSAVQCSAGQCSAVHWSLEHVIHLIAALHK